MKKSEKTHQGLYNVGFIGIENKGGGAPGIPQVQSGSGREIVKHREAPATHWVD
jgi:hypothetical protein